MEECPNCGATEGVIRASVVDDQANVLFSGIWCPDCQGIFEAPAGSE